MILKKTILVGVLTSFSVLVSAGAFDADSAEALERTQFLDRVNAYTHQQSINHLELIGLAEQGDKEAAWYVSQMYHRGILLDKDVSEAEKYARLAGLNGNPDAQDYLSRHPDLSRQEQLAWSNEGASASHPRSLFYLGKAFLEEDGVPRDIDLALFYLSRSASLGYEPAQRLRQDILDQQIQLPAFEDVLENARSGQVDALKRLAEAYRNGIIIDRDIAKADLIDHQIDKLVQFEPNHTVNGYK